MKVMIIIGLCVGTMLLCSCAANTENQGLPKKSDRSESRTSVESTMISEAQMDDTAYIGEYLDSDNEEPNLEIAKGDNGNYIVQIGIHRLTFLSDGVGELTADGMNFTATDAAGNPMKGVITLEDQTAIVTFTDSTWENLQNGSVFYYKKSSDVPNVWAEH